MKSFMLICLLSTMTIAAQAQSVNNKIPVSETPATPVITGNTASKPVYAGQDGMSFINMRVKDNWAFFDNIDGLGLINVHVTNASGREVLSRRISGKTNAVDVTALKKGLYFITLISENTENRKAFTISL